MIKKFFNGAINSGWTYAVAAYAGAFGMAFYDVLKYIYDSSALVKEQKKKGVSIMNTPSEIIINDGENSYHFIKNDKDKEKDE